MPIDTLACLKEFHSAFEQVQPSEPTLPPTNEIEKNMLAHLATEMELTAKSCHSHAANTKNLQFLRLQLIQEELGELAEAFAKGDLVETLDALIDLQYVVDGTFDSLGLGPVKEEAFMEVHRSNMSKLGPDGKRILDEAGRIVKGPAFFRPNLKAILEAYQLRCEQAKTPAR